MSKNLGFAWGCKFCRVGMDNSCCPIHGSEYEIIQEKPMSVKDALYKDFIEKEGKMDGQTLKSGEKKDEGKARFELLPYDVLAAVARILTAGAKKYADRNWEKGIAYGRVFGAAQRHQANFWNAHLNGSDGINHADGNEMDIDHAICELMFISAYEKRNKREFDDRPTTVELEIKANE